jgi:hypothetical protein
MPRAFHCPCTVRSSWIVKKARPPFDSNTGNWIYNYKLREQTSSVEEFGILPAMRRLI